MVVIVKMFVCALKRVTMRELVVPTAIHLKGLKAFIWGYDLLPSALLLFNLSVT